MNLTVHDMYKYVYDKRMISLIEKKTHLKLINSTLLL